MDKFLAIFAVALGAVYSDLGEGDWIGRFVFPALFVGGMAYLFWFKGFLAIILGVAAAYHSDMSSTSIMQGVLLPLFVVVCVLYLLIWLHAVGLFDHDGCGVDTDGDGSGFGGFSGCDGGGGGD